MIIQYETYEDWKDIAILREEDEWDGKYKTYGEMWKGEGALVMMSDDSLKRVDEIGEPKAMEKRETSVTLSEAVVMRDYIQSLVDAGKQSEAEACMEMAEKVTGRMLENRDGIICFSGRTSTAYMRMEFTVLSRVCHMMLPR